MLSAQTPATTTTRSRRKRVAIEIPAELELANMDPKDVKKLKNRIAAARLRERSQQQIRELQAMVQYYKSRTEYLESVTANCANCACLTQMQLPPQSLDVHAESAASSLTQFETPLQHHHHHFADASLAHATSTGSQCHSPASSTEDEYMGDCDFTLDDIDCDLLSKMLLMTE